MSGYGYWHQGIIIGNDRFYQDDRNLSIQLAIVLNGRGIPICCLGRDTICNGTTAEMRPTQRIRPGIVSDSEDSSSSESEEDQSTAFHPEQAATNDRNAMSLQDLIFAHKAGWNEEANAPNVQESCYGH